MPLTCGSLFSGIGSGDLGFERAGFVPRWFVEIDPDCQRVLRHHWPNVPVHGDITTIDPADLAPVDVITFGFPCQDLSVAGKRAGLEGARSGLFWEAMCVIKHLRPTVAIAENVPGLLGSHRGRDMAAVLWGLQDAGYDRVGWAVLDAQWFGVPQRRRRVFIVGCTGASGFNPSEILAFADGLSGHPPPRRTPGKGIAAALSASTACRGTDDPDRLSYIAIQDAAMPREKRQNGIGIAYDAPMYTLDGHGAHAVAATVSSKWAKGTGGPAGDEVLHLVAHTLTANGADASEDGTGRGTPLVVDLAQVTSPGNYSNPRAGGTGHPLTSAAGQSVVAFNWQSGGDQRLGISADHTTALGTTQTPAVAQIASTIVRRLTPTECLRLQGLPDDWLDTDPPLSDSAKYRMVGNATAVPVMEWIARRLFG